MIKAPSRCKSQYRLDAVVAALECGELNLALDRDPESIEPLFEQASGLRLRQHQPVRVWALHTVHGDAADDLVAGDEIDRLGPEPGVDERARPAAPVQQLERPAPQHECLRLVGPLRRLVDDDEEPHRSGRVRKPRSFRRDQRRRSEPALSSLFSTLICFALTDRVDNRACLRPR